MPSGRPCALAKTPARTRKHWVFLRFASSFPKSDNLVYFFAPFPPAHSVPPSGTFCLLHRCSAALAPPRSNVPPLVLRTISALWIFLHPGRITSHNLPVGPRAPKMRASPVPGGIISRINCHRFQPIFGARIAARADDFSASASRFFLPLSWTARPKLIPAPAARRGAQPAPPFLCRGR